MDPQKPTKKIGIPPQYFCIIPTSCAILPTMHHPIHSNNNYVRYTQLSHTPLCTHRLSTAHLRSFHKPFLPCSASLAFSTKPTLSMHINMH